jgi:hypothetical protein
MMTRVRSSLESNHNPESPALGQNLIQKRKSRLRKRRPPFSLGGNDVPLRSKYYNYSAAQVFIFGEAA